MRPAPRRLAAALAALTPLVASTGCLVDPPLPGDAVRYAPPMVYARWWAMVEACSGITRPLGALQFYRVPHTPTVPDGRAGDVAAYYSPASDRIVLADAWAEAGSVVRHEMLHALLQAPGHPRAAFLGRCGGVVACSGTCLTDAGPAPAPDPQAVPVDPRDLEVTAAVSPAAPSLAVDSGFFTFTVRVRNPKPYPVVVVAPPPPVITSPIPLAPSSVRYQLRVDGAQGGFETAGEALATDPTGYAYAPGEVRQRVYDLSYVPGATGWFTTVYGRADAVVLGTGRYVIRGTYGNFYGGRSADSAVVMLGP